MRAGEADAVRPQLRAESASARRPQQGGLRALSRRAPGLADALRLRRHRRGALRLPPREAAGRLFAVDGGRKPEVADVLERSRAFLPDARAHRGRSGLGGRRAPHRAPRPQTREHSPRRGGARRGQRLGHLVAARRERDGVDAQRRTPYLRYGGVRLARAAPGRRPARLEVRHLQPRLPHVRVGDRPKAVLGHVARDPGGENSR